MRVYNVAFHDAKSIAHHDISGFSSHSGKAEQFFHGMRHLAIIISNDALASSADIFGLVAVKAGRFDILFKLFLADGRKVFNAAILAKKVFRYDVDAFVGTLGSELRGNEQLERCGEVK